MQLSSLSILGRDRPWKLMKTKLVILSDRTRTLSEVEGDVEGSRRICGCPSFGNRTSDAQELSKEHMMSVKRIGAENAHKPGALPFARAVEAGGWLYVSGQVPLRDGELVPGNIGAQARQAIQNLIAVLNEAGYGPEHVVRCGVWLDDARDFAAFNAVFREFFGQNPPARSCVQSQMVVDCKVEIDCVAYKDPRA
jgi:reactive intermediate/imine deaminase